MKAAACLALLSIVALQLGCTTGPAVSASQVGTVLSVTKGTIVDIRTVTVKGVSRSPGSVGPGATLGRGVVTSAILGNPFPAAVAVGNVAGGALGAMADDEIADELTIRMENGTTIAVIQERGTEVLYEGESVRVISGGSGLRGSARVEGEEILTSLPEAAKVITGSAAAHPAPSQAVKYSPSGI